MDCFICFELLADNDEHIQVNSSTWHELNIERIIEKHLWPMVCYKNKSQWLCVTCWRILNDFHGLYMRLETLQNASTNKLCDLEPSLTQSTKSPQDTEVKDFVKIKSYGSNMVECENYEDKERNNSERAEVSTNLQEFDNDSDTSLLFKEDEEFIPINFLGPTIVDEKENDVHKSKKQLNNDPLLCKLKINKNKTENKAKKFDSLTTEKNNSGRAKVSTNLQEIDNDSENNLLISDNANKSPLHYFYEFPIDKSYYDAFLAKHFKLTCCKCKTTVTKFNELHQHFSEAHNIKQGYAVCCGLQFRKRGVLVNHINMHLNPAYFKCEYCSHISESITRFKNHKKSHGNVVNDTFHKKLYRCSVCDKSFKSKPLLHSHKLTHIPDDERKFSCTDCKKTFAREHLLTSHQRVVHLKTYFQLCDICGEHISKVESFKRHMDRHKGITPPVFSCEICGRVMGSKHCLSVHMKSIHPKDGKHDYVCHVCSKVYPNKIARREHIRRVHRTDNVFKCTICEKAFKRKDYLKDHMATHTGVGLPTCPYCSKTFNSNSTMHQHRKKAHTKQWEEARIKKYSGKLPPPLKLLN